MPFVAGEERGAAVALIGFMLAVILGAGSLAVDLSSLATTGQRLQNAADAAALAGAGELLSADETRVEDAIYEILAQNGVPDDVIVTITYPSSRQVTVQLTDAAPETLLPMGGMLESVSRTASAVHTFCESSCAGEFTVPAPLGAIDALGSGDGFKPMIVGNRLYSINHHSSTVACVDLTTEAACWPGRQAFSIDGLTTNNVHNPYLLGTKIYFLGHTVASDFVTVPDGYLYLACWETVTDTPCSTAINLGQQGHGSLAGTENGLYVLTSSRRMFCYDPALGATSSLDYDDLCPGYSEYGELTELTDSPDWSLAGTNMWAADQRIHDNKIYQTISNVGEVWIHCWDIAIDGNCEDFGGAVNTGGGRYGTQDWATQSRLFFGRSDDGEPESICAFGQLAVACLRLINGAPDTIMNDALTPLRDEMIIEDAWQDGWPQTALHHGSSNRLFLSASRISHTFCYDFTLAEKCGLVENTTAFGPAQTYGYTSAGDNCVIGLGHNAIFFSLKPDLSGPCTETAGTFQVTSCQCDSDTVWPDVITRNTGGLQLFEVQPFLPSGEVLVLPNADADGFIDLLNVDLDLSEAGDHPYLTFGFRAEASLGNTPWQSGLPPGFEFQQLQATLRLVD